MHISKARWVRLSKGVEKKRGLKMVKQAWMLSCANLRFHMGLGVILEDCELKANFVTCFTFHLRRHNLVMDF
jgi:hypothetical protein